MNLPTEIETHLLKFLHPYYLGIYSRVCKQSHEVTSYLLKGINVKMSLLTDPILLSKRYFDSVTLFYHACEANQEDVLSYLDGKYTDIIFFILWKFARVKEIKKLYFEGSIRTQCSQQVLRSMCRLYPGLKAIADNVRSSCMTDWHKSFDAPEFFTPYEKAKWDISFFSIPMGLYSCHYVVGRYARYLSKEQMEELFPLEQEEAIVLPSDVIIEFPIDGRLAFIQNNIPEPYQGVHYLTAGYLDQFEIWKKKGHKLIYDDRVDTIRRFHYVHVILCVVTSFNVIVLKTSYVNNPCDELMTKAKKMIDINDSRCQLRFIYVYGNKFGSICMSPYLPLVQLDGTQIDLRLYPEIFETKD